MATGFCLTQFLFEAGQVNTSKRSNPPGKHRALQECHGHPSSKGTQG